MGLSQMPFLPLQHCHAAGALLLSRWPSGAECPPLRCHRLAPRRTGYWTAPSPPLAPPHTPHTHTHTHTAPSREAKLCSVMVHSILSKTSGQTPHPLNGWAGPAPFAVWVESAWSPRWVNKLLLREAGTERGRLAIIIVKNRHLLGVGGWGVSES